MRLVLLTLLMSAAVGRAHAQSAPKLGVLMTQPAAAGVIWHVTKRVAIRHDITFTRTRTDFDTGLRVTTWTATGGLAGVIYLKTWDAARCYVSPRFAYSRT